MNYNKLQQPITITKSVFTNFTSQYLLPQTKLFDEETTEALNNTTWLAFGIADRKYPKYTEYDNKLFALASTKKGMQYWLDNKEHYLYQDGEANKVMVIFELPINNRNAFLEGSWSTIYPLEDLEDLISEYQTHNNIQYPDPRYSIIAKKEEAKELFENKRNKDFNLIPSIDVSKEEEYEYPPVLIREIFNYGNESQV